MPYATDLHDTVRFVANDDDVPTPKDTVAAATGELLSGLPIIGGALKVIITDWNKRRAARLNEYVELVTADSTEEQLAQRLASSPQFESAFMAAAEAAARTPLDAKRKLLARAVGQALTDDAKLDEAQLLSDTLSQLDVPHVKALAQMDAEWNEVLEKGGPSWGQSSVWDALPDPIKGALIRTGTGMGVAGGIVEFTLTETPQRQDGITDYGLEVVAALRADGLPGQRPRAAVQRAPAATAGRVGRSPGSRRARR